MRSTCVRLIITFLVQISTFVHLYKIHLEKYARQSHCQYLLIVIRKNKIWMAFDTYRKINNSGHNFKFRLCDPLMTRGKLQYMYYAFWGFVLWVYVATFLFSKMVKSRFYIYIRVNKSRLKLHNSLNKKNSAITGFPRHCIGNYIHYTHTYIYIHNKHHVKKNW